MIFKKRSNGHKVIISNLVWLWVLLFGVFYFAAKGVWTHFVVSLLCGILSAGLSWLVYPFFAKKIMRTHYLNNGWVEISGAKKKKRKTTK